MEKNNRVVSWRRGLAAVGATVFVALAVCEAMGWPFLVGPLQRRLSSTLERPVQFGEDGARPQASIHLLGGIKVATPYFRIGAPSWSTEPQMLLARDARLVLGYMDMWRASRGGEIHIRELRAAHLEGHLERLADGRASWQFGKQPSPNATPKAALKLPTFGRLLVSDGGVVYRDAVMDVQLDGTFSLAEGAAMPPAGSASASTPASGASGTGGLQFQATGSYRRMPLQVDLHTPGVLDVVAEGADAVALPVKLDANIGGARMSFIGTATDALHLTALKGRFNVKGPSLAAMGGPLGLTLPTTGPFNANGLIAKDGVVWKAVLEQVGVGSSRLGGEFTFDPRPQTPELAGRLTASRLLLTDLGPTVGAPVSSKAPGTVPKPAKKPTGARVLPDRAFDLPSLRAMNANVLINIDYLDLNSGLLDPLKPMRAHLLLQEGVLKIKDIDARTGQGRLAGLLQLDGRQAKAKWDTDLVLSGVKLERWLHQTRSGNAPPYITGTLNGEVRLAGEGKSTAAILGSLRGGVRLQLVKGTLSHLAIEAAGIDIAQGLGVLIKGDESLSTQCAIADFTAEQGVLKPRVFVIDTSDSTLWVNGSVSMATEGLDLRVTVTPKDFSPLALRTPLLVQGSFGDPKFSLEKTSLGTRLGTAALLSLINPLAALIPLIDTGDSDAAKRGDDECKAFAKRIAAKPGLPSPSAAPPARPPTRPTASLRH